MPTYDLRCIKCEKEFEIFASMKEREERSIQCPECKSTEFKALFKAAPIVRQKELLPKY